MRNDSAVGCDHPRVIFFAAFGDPPVGRGIQIHLIKIAITVIEAILAGC